MADLFATTGVAFSQSSQSDQDFDLGVPKGNRIKANAVAQSALVTLLTSTMQKFRLDPTRKHGEVERGSGQ